MIITGSVVCVSMADQSLTVKVDSVQDEDNGQPSIAHPEDMEGILFIDDVYATNNNDFYELEEGDDFELQVTREWVTSNDQ